MLDEFTGFEDWDAHDGTLAALVGAQEMGHDVTFVMNPIPSPVTTSVVFARFVDVAFVPLLRRRPDEFFCADRPVTLGE